MLEKNQEIKQAAKSAEVYLWQIAEKMGITDGAFSRKLRTEFSSEMRERVLRIIDELEQERKKEEGAQ